jgi:cobyric acid synthase
MIAGGVWDRFRRRQKRGEEEMVHGQQNEAMAEGGRAWGTRVHGVFDTPQFRRL